MSDKEKIDIILEYVNKFQPSIKYNRASAKYYENPFFSNSEFTSIIDSFNPDWYKKIIMQDILDIAPVILDKKPVSWINNYPMPTFIDIFIEYAKSNGVYFLPVKNFWNKDSLICSKNLKLLQYTQRIMTNYIEAKNPSNIFHVRMGILFGYSKESIKDFLSRLKNK